MQPVDLTTPLFYRFLGVDRDGFIDAANRAKQRSRQLQNKPNTDLHPPEAQRREVHVRQNLAQIPLVSTSLSVPRSIRSPQSPTEQQLTPPLPNYQQFTPSFVGFRQTPIDIYA